MDLDTYVLVNFERADLSYVCIRRHHNWAS